ncbi:TD and POZ domain-containing protein 5 [Argiope bruennichi]|uniref:TD and POZ domain-containing protein 5 n=1 Tax=Argiope bruennichi TaxID=94029 RepID=A0A8T0EGB7_ARGBR|nr:TD and POZ domain-containing protein 5 [Argiope bruennichi]
MKWSINNAQKIPERIKSPKFSFAPGFHKDWYLTIHYTEDGSICILLNRDSKDDQPVRVESETCVIDGSGERFPVKIRSIFDSKETHVICNHLCIFSKESLDCTLHLEFSFVLYGLEVETEISYRDDESIDDADETGKNFSDMMQNEKLADVQIHVGTEVFTAHKFIIRLRAPKFVDKHLRYGNKTTLRNFNPEIFKSLISYIYKNEVSVVQLSQCPKELYEVAGRYELKRLQKICTQELKRKLTLENVVEYLKMAEDYKEESLQRAASLFIKKNLDAMYQRTDWTTLIAARPNLESEVLHSSKY